MFGSKINSQIVKLSRVSSTLGKWVSPDVGKPPRRKTEKFLDRPSYGYPHCVMDPNDSTIFKPNSAKEEELKWRRANDEETWDFITQYQKSVPGIDSGNGNFETIVEFFTLNHLMVGEYEGKVAIGKIVIPDVVYPGIFSFGGLLVWPEARGKKLLNLSNLHNIRQEIPGINYFLQNVPGLEEAYNRDWGYRYVPERYIHYEGKYKSNQTLRELMRIKEKCKYRIKSIAEISIESLLNFDKAIHYPTKRRRELMKHVWKEQLGLRGVAVADRFDNVLGVACAAPCHDMQILGPFYSTNDEVSKLLLDLLPYILQDGNMTVSVSASNELGRKYFEDCGLKVVGNTALMFRLKTPEKCLLPGKRVFGISPGCHAGFTLC